MIMENPWGIGPWSGAWEGKIGKRRFNCVLALGFFVSLGIGGAALGDSAMVLPKGVSSVNVIYYNYFDIDERYDPDGDAEDIAANYNADLNSTVFPSLALLEASAGGPLPDGSATLGQSLVDFTLKYRWWEIAYAYGLSDRLTLGILIPYNNSKNNVNAVIDSTTATVGVIPVVPYLVPTPLVGGPGTPLTTQQHNRSRTFLAQVWTRTATDRWISPVSVTIPSNPGPMAVSETSNSWLSTNCMMIMIGGWLLLAVSECQLETLTIRTTWSTSPSVTAPPISSSGSIRTTQV
ncbi:MAG: hypothetical protein RRA15_11885 [bacterium]|nr:hypothetical protein [bacterium]MDT8367166.1 hypothetical protein [bacterium]